MKKAATSWRPAAIAAGLPAATAGAERRLSSPAPLLLSDKAVRERLPRGAHPQQDDTTGNLAPASAQGQCPSAKGQTSIIP